MRQTKERESNCRLAVDIEGLAAMLSCGQMTARKIAEDAGARITIGRRVLYSVRTEGGEIPGSNSGIEEHGCAWGWFCAILFIDRTRPFPTTGRCEYYRSNSSARAIRKTALTC